MSGRVASGVLVHQRVADAAIGGAQQIPAVIPRRPGPDPALDQQEHAARDALVGDDAHSGGHVIGEPRGHGPGGAAVRAVVDVAVVGDGLEDLGIGTGSGDHHHSVNALADVVRERRPRRAAGDRTLPQSAVRGPYIERAVGGERRNVCAASLAGAADLLPARRAGRARGAAGASDERGACLLVERGVGALDLAPIRAGRRAMHAFDPPLASFMVALFGVLVEPVDDAFGRRGLCEKQRAGSERQQRGKRGCPRGAGRRSDVRCDRCGLHALRLGRCGGHLKKPHDAAVNCYSGRTFTGDPVSPHLFRRRPCAPSQRKEAL